MPLWFEIAGGLLLWLWLDFELALVVGPRLKAWSEDQD